MKKILITGITGFVGSHMADYIFSLKEKHKVYGLKRWHLSKLDNIYHIKDKIIFFDCDITDSVSTIKMIEKIKPDIIFHFAAESFVSPSWDHPNRYMSVNYNGTVNILEGMRRINSKAYIHIPGSGEEYGKIYDNEVPIDELSPLRPVNPYAVSKVSQDLIAYVYNQSYNLNVIRTRAFNHEGPRRQNVFGIPSYAYQIARIEKGLQKPLIKVGKLNDRRNFTHVRDLVKAYYLSVKKCKPGELYTVGNHKKNSIHTFKDALRYLISKSKVKNIKYIEYKPFVRPTSVPRLISTNKKFRNAPGCLVEKIQKSQVLWQKWRIGVC